MISLEWVKDYIDISDQDLEELAVKITKAGINVEKVINNKMDNIVIGEVLECEDHPNSDHLHICQVAVGNDEVKQIVCGAPNVRKGLKVIVSLPGAILPGDIEIKKSKIRGVESNGMLCSKAELGIDSKFLSEEDIKGIYEFNNDVEIGTDAIKALELDDEVIDFELTSNRGDELSILGLAYELGAIYDKKVKDIDLSYNEIKDDVNNEFSIDIQTDNCSLFLAKKVKNVVIKESPEFIKNRLIASGIRPINNVVDISNYVMLETGQPLHYYDADRLGDTLVVRAAKEGEKLTTLDSIERDLTEEDIVIANKTDAVGLAGVMGGLSTEVEEDTKNIIIEAAIFNSVKIRKTSKKILRSEASNRFEKGLDPKRTYMAIDRCCNLLSKYADATIVGGIVEYNKTNSEDKIIEVSLDKINKVLGVTIKEEEVIDILIRLGFKVTSNNKVFTVIVPSRRLDISIKEDIIEEVK